MAQHNETELEREICEELAENGWFHSKNDDGYDVERALFPRDVFEWLRATQPDALARLVQADAPDRKKQENQLLDRLVAELNKPMPNGGALKVLRNGFKVSGAGAGTAKLSMMQRRPESTRNKTTLAHYAANRLRVMQQVHYGEGGNSIDLVFFVNGIPVATAEVKTENTQKVGYAIEQYKRDRLPQVKNRKHALLGEGTRALVHFAVSEDEVWMTTKLDGQRTRFLPFNMGDEDGGAGNPLNPDGRKTDYLWKRVLHRDAWLAILGRFIWVKKERKRDKDTGRETLDHTLRFPRFHQWEVVEKIGAAVVEEGAGKRYLIQHSAGSGKTDSIAWSAHRLARIQVNNEKIFQSVIVVTDRNVLDAQLQEAITQIDEDNSSIVATINEKTVRESGSGSKSGALANALANGKLIIVVTIQTFPFVLDQLQKGEAFAGKTFAVIADEAHSSQSGQTAAKLKSVLTTEQQAELEETGEVEVDVEQMIANEMANRVRHDNVSFFAFTATPKAKTLELFGRRPSPDAQPEPFHLYTMKQAIDEEYILDVLQGYRTYDMLFSLAEKLSGALDVEVDKSKASKEVMQWVRVHPQTIAQKAAVIVEHFQANVAHLLDGNAKAMVVSLNRLGAVRYKREIDKYIAKKKLDYRTLVAFSGAVNDPDTSAELGIDTLSEGTMNDGARDLRRTFQGDDYRVMIVANKFQTGFDQPLLCAMYVDKQLSGITAVQTLSRLNRTHSTAKGTVKDAHMTQVVDFVNDPAEIEAAFKPYYRDAKIEQETDPNLIHDVLGMLDDAGIYEDAEVEQVAHVFLTEGTGEGSKVNAKIAAGLGPAKKRYSEKLKSARQREDKLELDELIMFRKNIGSFLRFYDFVTQIFDYEDTEIAKKAIYLRLLAPNLRDSEAPDRIDLSGVELTRLQLVDEGAKDLSMDGGGSVHGAASIATGAPQDPVMVALAEVIRMITGVGIAENEAQAETFTEYLLRTAMDNRVLVGQATANEFTQFIESPDFHDAMNDAVMESFSTSERAAQFFYGDDSRKEQMVQALGRLIWEAVRRGENTG
jgi:type I restriction enzyme R subunit